jgi:hypothetical protein
VVDIQKRLMFYQEIPNNLSVFQEYSHFASNIETVRPGFISSRNVVQIFAVIGRDFTFQDLRDLALAISPGYERCNLLAEVLRRSDIIDLGYYYPDYSGLNSFPWKAEIEETHKDKFWELAAQNNSISCATLQEQRKSMYEEDKMLFYFQHAKGIRSGMTLDDLLDLADS